LVPKNGGTLILGTYGDLFNLDPHLTSATVNIQFYHANIYETLIDWKPDISDFMPVLAESYTVSSDNKAITFVLRQGVKFHSGKAMTSADVKANIMRSKSMGGASYFGSVASIDTPDDKTVVLNLSQPDASIFDSLTITYGAIIDVDQMNAKNYAQSGTGPFMYKEWIKNDHASMVKNPNYWGTPAYLDGVKYAPIPDESTRISSLNTQAIDLVNRPSFSDVGTLQKNSNLTVLTHSGTNVTTLDFVVNNKSSPLYDVRVRQALAWALDKQQIAQAALYGQGEINYTHLPVASPYNAHFWPYTQDFTTAKNLLAQAGYPNGFTINLTLGRGVDDEITAGQVINSQLSNIGVTANLQIVDTATWLDVYFKQNYDALIIYWDAEVDPNSYMGIKYNSTSKFNPHGYSNPMIDQLLTQGVQTLDQASRIPIYKKIEIILATDVPSIALYSWNNVEALQNYVQGYKQNALWFPEFGASWLNK
jgi:peptide/nickel transport system substrate-binding protein